MKNCCKLLAFVFICISLYGVLSFILQYKPSTVGDEQFEKTNTNMSFETWGNDLSNVELEEYYKKNEIYPMSAPSGTEDVLVGEVSVANNLMKRFNGYKNWTKTTNSKDVGYYHKIAYNDTRDFNPKEIDEDNDIIQAAKRSANLASDYAIGCGPLSMFCQFEFLARYAGYQLISPKLYNQKDIIPFSQYDSEKDYPISDEESFGAKKLAKEIFENTDTIAVDSTGTFTWPSEVIDSSMELLEKYGLAQSFYTISTDDNGNEVREKHYSRQNSAIIVKGDLIANASSFETKINNIKRSIDNGMPVIWWTLPNAGGYKNHFMNIYGYEYWKGTNDNGNEMTHLMFKLRMNWGMTTEVFMDSDLLRAINGGFIFFCETRYKASLRPNDYNYECQYFFNEQSKTVVPSVGSIVFQTNRLRTGYVNHYDSTNTKVDRQYLTMSPDRKDAGVAFLEYSTTQKIKRINIELCWWGHSEGVVPITGTVLIQYKKEDGTWATALDLQTINPSIPRYCESPMTYMCVFEEASTQFRIYVACADVPTSNKNKGRLIIGNLIAYYGGLLPLIN